MKEECTKIVLSEWRGKKIRISTILDLIPKGCKRARTIKVIWYGLSLYITADRRRDKHGIETIVYQVSTFQEKPIVHVKIYKKRWKIEEFFRTIKQKLGLQDCASTKKELQLKHVHSVFLAYALASIEQRIKKFLTVEDAIRALGRKKIPITMQQFSALIKIFDSVYA